MGGASGVAAKRIVRGVASYIYKIIANMPADQASAGVRARCDVTGIRPTYRLPRIVMNDSARATTPSFATHQLDLNVNAILHKLQVSASVTLLDLLREQLHLTGAKKGCDHGQCGACTVLLDGCRINSCLKLAVTLDGANVTTIEGIGSPFKLHPLQQAFIDHDAFQCGYCTPGQICSAKALIDEGVARSRDDVREWMSGNLCRCGAYSNITDAILQVMDETGQDAP
jgi:xanthine dehydrogenase YagT iron-sulfur-binding subunit